MSKVERIVTALAAPVAAAAGCELWNVEFVREGGRAVLRVYIDREGGVSTQHCEAVSRALDPLLDEADPIPGAYTLEVSSTGLERPLRRDSDFARFIGHAVSVRLYAPRDGAREFVGTLSGHDGQTVVLDDGALVFDKKEVALVRLHVDWTDAL
ncbi:MAG: ribosome maturation factor RimP [Oscillospiraceae bacterium]|jgi:ribosome maturation factor RimP|nr:ribosome maturation factor RimP [Oscillospiraceae bacterium]